MNQVDRMLIEHECCKLMLMYCQHIDHLSLEAFAELFSQDGYYNPAAHPEMNGRREILKWEQTYPKNRLARQVSTNQVVEVIDEKNANGVSYAVVCREEKPSRDRLSENVVPRAVVEYQDTFRLTRDGWRIASREYNYYFLKENN